MKKTIAKWLYIGAGMLFMSGGCKKDNALLPEGLDNSVTPNDFLSGSHYTKLVIEVQSMTGAEPTQGTLDNLQAFLQQRLNKPDGVEIVQTHILPTKSVYSLRDITDIEFSHRHQHTGGSTLTAYFLFVNGSYDMNTAQTSVLGVAYWPSSMVIFDQTIHSYSGGLGQPSVVTLEISVSEHEFGHILGLVNNGSAMQTSHQDEPHGKHCNNQNCLMYWEAENSNLVGNLFGNNIPTLDANCLNDLQANGGK